MNKRYEPPQEVAELIIEKYKNGVSGCALAVEFNVSKPTIYNFLKRSNVEVKKDTESKNIRYGSTHEIEVSCEAHNDFYVYLHRDMNGQVFYVGKGRNNRYKDKSNRGVAWKIRAKAGYSYEFYRESLNEDCALKLESELINTLSGLVNSPAAKKLEFSRNDFVEHFSVNEASPSGISRLKSTWTGTYFKGSLGDVGYVSVRNGKQYWRVKFKNKSVMVHRIIWTIANGEIPDNFVIDHIDGNGLNNKLENLRIVSKAVNCKNKTLNKNNSTGQTGVYKLTDDNLSGYRAIVIENSNRKSKRFYNHKLGEQEAFRLACEWRKEQIRLLNEQGAGYTERHGT